MPGDTPATPARAARSARAKKPPPSPFDPVDRLPGLGPSSRAALGEHGIATVADLAWVAPSSWDDLRSPISLTEAVTLARSEAESGIGRGAHVAAAAVVHSASVVPIRGRRCIRVLLRDASDAACKVHAFWFFMAHGVLALAKPDVGMLVVGRIRAEPGKPPRIAHPDLFLDTTEMRAARPRYPRIGPAGAAVRKAIAHAVETGLVVDPVPAAIAKREGFDDVRSVLAEVHVVGRTAPPSPEARAAFVERLAWAEAFTRSWERVKSEAEGEGSRGVALAAAPTAVAALEKELGFAFTRDQRAAVDTVTADLAADRPMRRLLLGDVGTGKTAVALAAAAQAVTAGKRVAILAPTSVLADQYVSAIAPLVRATKTEAVLLTAGMPAAARRASEAAVAKGTARVVVGTHALLSDAIVMDDLGLVVVDEQQRLGVGQRLALVKKGASQTPHLLSLSATPIPRTLALALRGELATTTLRERPKGRKPVSTSLAARSALGDVVAQVGRTVAEGGRVFWITPRIEPDEDETDLDPSASAKARAAALREALDHTSVALLHGAMKPEEKRAAMKAFREGESSLLVGTTVLEVGVDVPEATLIVVEDAELFGLAQLHQLRGRVGRGAAPGACVLLHGDDLSALARSRLDALVRLEHGEDIARADLDLRGAGDLGGTRQHGAEEELLYLDPATPYPWLERVEADARATYAADPALAAEDHRALGALVKRLGHVIAVRAEAG